MKSNKKERKDETGEQMAIAGLEDAGEGRRVEEGKNVPVGKGEKPYIPPSESLWVMPG